MEPDQREIGRVMRAARHSTGRTLRGVAADLGISPAYLSDLELGRRQWRKTLMDQFMAALR
jgi:cytoskeletal protein RodZ